MSAWTAAIAVLVGALVAHVLFVRAFPRLVMFIVGRVFKGPTNEMIHMPPTNAQSRAVVRPSPDLLYSAIIYDVRSAPLLIEAVVPDTYWSISFFANNTDNYFVANDRNVGTKNPRFVLVGDDRDIGDQGSAQILRARTKKGVVLLRSLVRDQAAVDEQIAVQRQARCERVPNL